MILFLYGTDTFRSKKKLSGIIEKYRSKYKSGLNFSKIDSKEENFDEFKNQIETTPMFQEKKLIILNNILSASKNFQDEIKEYLAKPISANTILIFFEENPIKKNNSLFKLLLKKSDKKQEFKELPPAQMKRFIQKEIETIGGKIEPNAILKLIFFYGNNLWQIANEIKKLIAFRKGKIIKEENIEELCQANINPNIFVTIEAISRKNKKRALQLISQLLEKRENEIKILSMIIFQFRNLIKIKSACEEGKNSFQIQKSLRIHPFVIRKTLPITQNFSMEELKKIYQKLSRLDFKIKIGKIEPRIGIEMFIMEL